MSQYTQISSQHSKHYAQGETWTHGFRLEVAYQCWASFRNLLAKKTLGYAFVLFVFSDFKKIASCQNLKIVSCQMLDFG